MTDDSTPNDDEDEEEEPKPRRSLYDTRADIFYEAYIYANVEDEIPPETFDINHPHFAWYHAGLERSLDYVKAYDVVTAMGHKLQPPLPFVSKIAPLWNVHGFEWDVLKQNFQVVNVLEKLRTAGYPVFRWRELEAAIIIAFDTKHKANVLEKIGYEKDSVELQQVFRRDRAYLMTLMKPFVLEWCIVDYELDAPRGAEEREWLGGGLVDIEAIEPAKLPSVTESEIPSFLSSGLRRKQRKTLSVEAKRNREFNRESDKLIRDMRKLSGYVPPPVDKEAKEEDDFNKAHGIGAPHITEEGDE